MCDFDGSDAPEVWRTSTQRARKTYMCHECRRDIAPGETYTRDFSVYCGDASTGIMCGHCLVARTWLSVNCGGWSDGLAGLMKEHAEEYPDIAFGLLRLVVSHAAGIFGLTASRIKKLIYDQPVVVSEAERQAIRRRYLDHLRRQADYHAEQHEAAKARLKQMDLPV